MMDQAKMNDWAMQKDHQVGLENHLKLDLQTRLIQN
jgi:hypothetical protein